jgi:hypothetical protein
VHSMISPGGMAGGSPLPHTTTTCSSGRRAFNDGSSSLPKGSMKSVSVVLPQFCTP